MNKTFFSTERGQALILISLAAVGLFAIAGLGIDGSAKFSDRRHAQNAADTAAMAGALARLRAEDQEPALTAEQIKDIMVDAALDRARDNGYDGDLVRSQVWVYSCDAIAGTSPGDCGPYNGDPNYVEVVITSHINTYFARVIGINQLHNTVRAVAMSQDSHKSELYGGDAIVALAKGQCKTIWFSGTARPHIVGGGVFSNSSLDCGLTIQGSTNITIEDRIDTVATAYTLNGNPPLGGISGGIHGGANQREYPPPAWMLPAISCSTDASVSGSSMSPGNWSGTFPPGGVTTLDPGTYCINGDFSLNAHDTLSGSGVTIYMESGGLTWNGGAEVNLSAPTSGDLAGMLIYAPMTNTNTMRFNGNAATTLTGTILMPAAPLIYNGTGNLQPSHIQLIAYTIELTGTNDSHIIYQDIDNWDSTNPAQLGIMQ
jgi:hypothetical protein